MKIFTVNTCNNHSEEHYYNNDSPPRWRAVFRKVLTAALVISFWLIVWHVLYLNISNHIIIPSANEVFCKMIALLRLSDTWFRILLCMFRAAVGFLAAAFLAIIFTLLKPLELLFSPLIIAVKITPIICFTLITLILMPSETVPSFIAFLAAFPVLYINIAEGENSIDARLIQASYLFDFTAKDRLIKVYVPAIWPYFKAACIGSAAMAWKACITAEVLASVKNSLGMAIQQSQMKLDVTSLIAWMIIITVLGTGLKGAK